MTAENVRPRCPWARSPFALRYHDLEWGVPLHDDRGFFEFLLLEGAQAGLSWETILRKREAYRKAFDGFDPARVARYGPRRVERLLGNRGIVRNRLKVESAVTNARAFLRVAEEFGSFDAFMWGFVDGRPRLGHWRVPEQIPASTPESEAMSRELKRRGFRFVGPTICYALMQATGLVNDHLVRCYRWKELGGS